MHHILRGVYYTNKPKKARKGVIITFYDPNQLWKKNQWPNKTSFYSPYVKKFLHICEGKSYTMNQVKVG